MTPYPVSSVLLQNPRDKLSKQLLYQARWNLRPSIHPNRTIGQGKKINFVNENLQLVPVYLPIITWLYFSHVMSKTRNAFMKTIHEILRSQPLTCIPCTAARFKSELCLH